MKTASYLLGVMMILVCESNAQEYQSVNVLAYYEIAKKGLVDDGARSYNLLDDVYWWNDYHGFTQLDYYNAGLTKSKRNIINAIAEESGARNYGFNMRPKSVPSWDMVQLTYTAKGIRDLVDDKINESVEENRNSLKRLEARLLNYIDDALTRMPGSLDSKNTGLLKESIMQEVIQYVEDDDRQVIEGVKEALLKDADFIASIKKVIKGP